MKVLLISIFGVMGVLSRYSIESYWGGMKTQGFPYSTLAINLIGCLVAGLIYSFIVHKQFISEDVATAVIVGFCGGLTTFSGYCLQGLNLMSNGEILKAIAYLVISVTLGLITVLMGVKLGSHLA